LDEEERIAWIVVIERGVVSVTNVISSSPNYVLGML